MQPLHVGMGWYSRENYARILAVMADAHVLPSTFDEWIKKAEAGEQSLSAQDRIVHRVDIDPDQFLAWCTSRNVDADAKARMAFSNEAVIRKLRHTG